jgi:hypothetical protein
LEGLKWQYLSYFLVNELVNISSTHIIKSVGKIKHLTPFKKSLNFQSMAPPNTFNLEKSLRIIDMHAKGKTMTQACESEDLSFATFREWADRNEGGISALYARAKEEHNRRLVDELQRITAQDSEFVAVDDHGRKDVSHAKLRGDFHRQYLYLLDRKTYGDSDETALGIDLSSCKCSADTLALLAGNARKIGKVQMEMILKFIESQQKTEEIQEMGRRLAEVEAKLGVKL